MCLAKDIAESDGISAFPKELPSSMWYDRFAKSHNIVLHIPRSFAISRADMSTEAVRNNLFDLYQKLINRLVNFTFFEPKCLISKTYYNFVCLGTILLLKIFITWMKAASISSARPEKLPLSEVVKMSFCKQQGEHL